MVRPPLSLLEIGDREYTEWYVLFLESDFKYWWTKYLQPGFTHCYVVRWTPLGWLYFNWGLGYAEVDAIVTSTMNPRKIEPKATHVLKVYSWRKSKLRMTGLPTCVESVKAILGIHHWCMTPYQLYKFLKKENEYVTVREV